MQILIEMVHHALLKVYVIFFTLLEFSMSFEVLRQLLDRHFFQFFNSGFNQIKNTFAELPAL